MSKDRAYQIPPTKKQETMVKRNKTKFKIDSHFLLSFVNYYILIFLINKVVSSLRRGKFKYIIFSFNFFILE
ncbi:MAG TPA: hypothetical protein DEG96_08515 [Candidatus Atribacteria bacterium]|nr:hypothetical protein [Candidatus Atribacteria bacterium]